MLRIENAADGRLPPQGAAGGVAEQALRRRGLPTVTDGTCRIDPSLQMLGNQRRQMMFNGHVVR